MCISPSLPLSLSRSLFSSFISCHLFCFHLYLCVFALCVCMVGWLARCEWCRTSQLSVFSWWHCFMPNWFATFFPVFFFSRRWSIACARNVNIGWVPLSPIDQNKSEKIIFPCRSQMNGDRHIRNPPSTRKFQHAFDWIGIFVDIGAVASAHR